MVWNWRVYYFLVYAGFFFGKCMDSFSEYTFVFDLSYTPSFNSAPATCQHCSNIRIHTCIVCVSIGLLPALLKNLARNRTVAASNVVAFHYRTIRIRVYVFSHIGGAHVDQWFFFLFEYNVNVLYYGIIHTCAYILLVAINNHELKSSNIAATVKICLFAFNASMRKKNDRCKYTNGT